MPILSSNTNHQWILSLKIILISTGVLSMAVFLKLSLPVVADFLLSEIPSIWTCFISWLRPPYLYLLINCIIITIVASSKIHHNSLDDYDDGSASPTPETPAPPIGYYSYNNVNQNYVATKISEEPSRVSEMEKKGDSDSLIVTPNALQQKKDSVGLLLFSDEKENQKPPASSRIGQRKFLKPTPEGKALGVSKPKRRQDTLESTWRTITEGRSMPLTRHLRKSASLVDPATPPPSKKVMKKSETFSGGGSPSPSPGSSGRVKRESSLTQDELNRRVEAFIKKFNDEMRLQRQDSLKQYQDMMGRHHQPIKLF